MGKSKKRMKDQDDKDLIKRCDESLSELQKLSSYIGYNSNLSEHAENIRLHPELLDSIEETDPIWNELFDYVIDSCTPFTIEGEVSIEEKIKIVCCWLPPTDPDTELWT